MSKTGGKYATLTLSDLGKAEVAIKCPSSLCLDVITQMKLFIFDRAFFEHWRRLEGELVCLMGANIRMEKVQSRL